MNELRPETGPAGPGALHRRGPGFLRGEGAPRTHARLKAKPSTPTVTHFRVRRDKVDRFGGVTLRYLGRLRHIHIGSAYKRWPVRTFVAGVYVRIVTEDGQLLRELTIDPTRNYRAQGATFIRYQPTQASGMT